MPVWAVHMSPFVLTFLCFGAYILCSSRPTEYAASGGAVPATRLTWRWLVMALVFWAVLCVLYLNFSRQVSSKVVFHLINPPFGGGAPQ